MKAQAYLLAFAAPDADDVKVRPIEIPDAEVNPYFAPEVVAELAFKYGQNDFQPVRGCYSVSVGDVINFEHDGKELFYMVEAVGFKLLNDEEVLAHGIA